MTADRRSSSSASVPGGLPLAAERKRIREDAEGLAARDGARARRPVDGHLALGEGRPAARARHEVAYADLLDELKRVAPEEVSA